MPTIKTSTTDVANSTDSRLNALLFPTVDWRNIISYVLWPISAIMVIHRSVFFGVNGARTDDFTPVYDAAYRFIYNLPGVYKLDYSSVSPHYLYPPSGTALMAPLGLVEFEYARWIFIALTVIAVVSAAILLTKLFGYQLNSPMAPVILFFMFSTETVANTLIFTNFNGVLFLAEVLFLRFYLNRMDLWAGTVLGITFAVKPVLAVLLLFPLLARRWKVFIFSGVIPVLLMAIGIYFSNDWKLYFKYTAPYTFFETRNYYNSSISGTGSYFGVQPWLLYLLRFLFLVMAIFSVWFLWKYYRKTNELLWLATASGVLLCSSFLIGSLGQGYYSMTLFPLLLTVTLTGSVMRNWPAWLAVYGCFTFDAFYSERWAAFGRAIEYNKVTWGWSLLMIVTCCVLSYRWLDIRRITTKEPDAFANR